MRPTILTLGLLTVLLASASPPLLAQRFPRNLSDVLRQVERGARDAERQSQRRRHTQPARAPRQAQTWASPAAALVGEQTQAARELGPVTYPDSRGPSVRPVPFDETALVEASRQDAAGANPVACVRQAVADANAMHRNGWHSDAASQQPIAFRSVATGTICLDRMVRKQHDDLMAALRAPPGAALETVAARVRAADAGAGSMDLGRFWYFLSQASGGTRDNPKARALHALWSCNDLAGSMFEVPKRCLSVTGTSEWTAMMRRFVAEAKATTDPARLRRLLNALLPFRNIEEGRSATTIGLMDDSGGMKDDLVRGSNPWKQAEASPTSENVHLLIGYQADPVARAIVAGRNAPGPKAQDLAVMFAEAYARGERAAYPNLDGGRMSTARWGDYGATAVWSAPQLLNTAYGYSDNILFLVNDLPGPSCTAIAKGYRCSLKIAFEAGGNDFLGRIGEAALAFLSNQPIESDAARKYRLEAKYTKRDYPWQEILVTVSGPGAAWRSAQVDAAIADVAKMRADRRNAMANARAGAQSGLSADTERRACRGRAMQWGAIGSNLGSFAGAFC